MSRINCLARSLSGHDKGEVFAVCGEGEKIVFLADGKSRTLDRPKKKNRRHVQIIRRLPQALIDEMGKASQDSDIIYILRLYRKINDNKELYSDTDRNYEEVQPCQNLT